MLFYRLLEQSVAMHPISFQDLVANPSCRRRRLPAEQVVWLLIALALYRHQSMPEVLATLDLALPSLSAPLVSKSAVKQARQRLGAAPLEQLFGQTASAWCAQDAERHAVKGLSLWAMDGTTFRAPDSADNRAHFGAQSYASGKVASYPQIRAVSITAIPTHLVADMAFGQYGQNEMLYAKPLVERSADHSLTVFDRSFLCAEILLGLTTERRSPFFVIGKTIERRSRCTCSHLRDRISPLRMAVSIANWTIGRIQGLCMPSEKVPSGFRSPSSSAFNNAASSPGFKRRSRLRFSRGRRMYAIGLSLSIPHSFRAVLRAWEIMFSSRLTVLPDTFCNRRSRYPANILPDNAVSLYWAITSLLMTRTRLFSVEVTAPLLVGVTSLRLRSSSSPSVVLSASGRSKKTPRSISDSTRVAHSSASRLDGNVFVWTGKLRRRMIT